LRRALRNSAQVPILRVGRDGGDAWHRPQRRQAGAGETLKIAKERTTP